MMVALRRHCAGPFQIDVRLRQVARGRVVPRITRPWHQQHLRIVGRQAEHTTELLDVGKIDLDLPGNSDLLPGSVDSGVVQRRDIVDGRKIAWRNPLP